MKNSVSLRAATEQDARFLFDVKICGMSPVHSALCPNTPLNLDEEFTKYMDSFEPKDVSVVVYKGRDVGRLRVVRTAESIYIGGLQLLPDFQKKGIGGVILRTLMQESDRTDVPLITETHHVNQINVPWKMKRRGFVIISRNDTQVTLQYN